MIKRLVLLAVAIGAFSACAPKAPDTAVDEAKLRTDSSVWFDHYNQGDADGVANLYTEDAVVLPDKAPATMGRAAFRAYIAADIAKSKAAGLTFQNGGVTGVGVSGDMAWLSGTFSVTDASGAAIDNGKYLSVYHRVGTVWMLVRDTWNSDKEPAPPAPQPTPKKGGKLGAVGRIFHR